MKHWIFTLCALVFLISVCSEIDALKQGQTVLEGIYQSNAIISHPSVVQTQNGNMLLVFASQNKSQNLPTQICAIKQNEHYHWSEPDTLLYSRWSCERPAISRLHDGLLYLVMTQKHMDQNKGCYVILSYDDGMHFSAPRKISIETIQSPQTHAPVLQLTDGSLLWPLEGVDSTGTRNAFVIKSMDRGETWENPILVAKGSGKPYHPQVIEVGDKLICLMDADQSGYLQISVSWNGGQTWEAPQNTSMYGTHPWAIHTPRGGIITCFNDQWPLGMSVRTSYDLGKTWENEKQLMARSDFQELNITGRLINDHVCEGFFVQTKDTSNEIMRLRFPVTVANEVRGFSVKREKNGKVTLRWNEAPSSAYYIIYRKEGTVLSTEEFSTNDRYRTIKQNHFVDMVEGDSTFSYAISSVLGYGPAISNTTSESNLCEPAIIKPFTDEPKSK